MQNKKQHAINIARQMFIENGYENTSLQQIIEKSGISKGGLYYYFSSKDEILEATVKEEFASFFEEMDRIVQDQGLNYREKILQIMAKKREFYTERYELMSHIFLGEEYLLLQHRTKMIVSPLFDVYIEQMFHESHGALSIEVVRILFGIYEMLFETALPYVQDISEFERYMDTIDNMIDSLLR